MNIVLIAWCAHYNVIHYNYTLQCYRGLTEGWEKILGLYSSVRDKGKEVLAQVYLFTTKKISSKKTFHCIFFGSNSSGKRGGHVGIEMRN